MAASIPTGGSGHCICRKPSIGQPVSQPVTLSLPYTFSSSSPFFFISSSFCPLPPSPTPHPPTTLHLLSSFISLSSRLTGRKRPTYLLLLHITLLLLPTWTPFLLSSPSICSSSSSLSFTYSSSFSPPPHLPSTCSLSSFTSSSFSYSSPPLHLPFCPPPHSPTTHPPLAPLHLTNQHGSAHFKYRS